MRSLSIGIRVTLITILSSVVTVVAVLLLAYHGLVSDFENVLTQRQILETEQAARAVDQELQIRLDALNTFASFLSDGDERLPLPLILNILGRQTGLERYFQGGLLVFDDQATAIAENLFVPNRVGTNYKDRPHFQQALGEREALISRPIIGRTTGLPLLSFLAPIKSDDGDLLGLAGGTINLAESGIIPASFGENTDTIFRVLDTNHFIQVDSLSPDSPMLTLPPPGENAMIDAALSGITSGIVEDERGQRWVYATRHLERVGWIFLRAEPYDRVTGPAWASFNTFVYWSMAALAILIVLAWWLARASTRPLARMSSNIRTMITSNQQTRRLAPDGPMETRELAQAFNELMEAREHLDQMKDQFVSTVSHELRTPLTSINGSLKLLHSGATGELPDKARSITDIALRNGEQLQRLISDLLDFNKVIAGKLPVYPEALSLANAIQQAADGNRVMAKQYGVELSSPPAEQPIKLWADPQRLRQILDNFISNAIKFSPGGGQIRITSQPLMDQRVRVVVSDQGQGVPADFVPVLFERFEQARSIARSSRAGTGLGLAICRELAHLMGGEVGYYYQDGAHFWVELPETPADTENHHAGT